MNYDLLEEAILKSGLKKSYIAEQLDLSAYGLSRKINGDSEFKASEIYILSGILNLNAKERDEIFFNHYVE